MRTRTTTQPPHAAAAGRNQTSDEDIPGMHDTHIHIPALQRGSAPARRAGWLAAGLLGLAAFAAQAGDLHIEARLAAGEGDWRLHYRIVNDGDAPLHDLRLAGRDASALACAARTRNGASFSRTQAELAPGDAVDCTLDHSRRMRDSGSARLIAAARTPQGAWHKAEHAYSYGAGASLSRIRGTPSLQTQAVLLLGAVHDDADLGFDFTPGETIDLTYTVVNTGDDALDTIAVTDSAANAISCPAGPVAPGAALVCTATYTIDAADDPFLLVFDASLTASGVLGGASANAQDSLLLLAGFTADARIFKAPRVSTDANGDGYASVGESIDYRFVIKNSSAETLTLDSLADPLPGLGPVTCAATTLGGAGFAGVPGGTLAAGDAAICSASYTVTPADRGNGQINNTAALSATSTPSGSNIATGASATVTVPSATVTISKTSIGDVGSFDFTLTNTDVATQTITTLVDGVPETGAPLFAAGLGNADIVVTETNPGPDFVLLTAQCTDGVSTWVFTDHSVTVPADALVPGAQIDCSFTNATAADLLLTKALTGESGSVAGQAEAGETLTYTIRLINAGFASATGVDITDTLDPNVVFASADNGGVHDGTAQGGDVDWVGLTVPPATGGGPGERVLTVNVTVVDPIPPGVLSIGNVVYDPDVGPPDCDASPTPPNCTQTATEPQVMLAKALFAESGATAGTAEAGEQLTYTITLTNTGGSPQPGTAVVDQLDPNVVFVSADNGGLHDGAAQGGAVDWAGLVVPANGTLVLTVVVQVVDPLPMGVTEIGNVAYDPAIGPPDCDAVPMPPNCTSTLTEPNVAIAKALTGEDGTRPGIAEPGERLTYTITLSNGGGTDATPQAITDTLDANVVFVSADNGGVHDGAAQGGDVDWTGLTVPANGTLVLTVVVTVVDPIPDGVLAIGNVAFDPAIGPPDCDAVPTPPNCTNTATEPKVSIVKALTAESGALAGIAEAGETLTYTITLTNAGGTDATPQAVTDTLDANVVFISTDNGGVHDGAAQGGGIDWTGLTVPANGSLVLTVVVTVVDPIPAGVTQIGNVAFDPAIGPPDCDTVPTPSNCTGIPTEPNVSIGKTLSGENGSTPGIAEPGEQLTYTITLSNGGGTDAMPQAVTDTLDPNVVFVSADNGGVHDGAAQSGAIDWTGLTVPANGTLVLTVVVTVVDPIPAGVTQIGNVAFDPAIGPPDCDAAPTPPNCTGIPTAPSVSIVKALTGESGTVAGIAEAGEQLTYTITLTNAGGTDATPQAVTDTLDANVVFVSASNSGVHDGAAQGGDIDWAALTVPANGTLALTVTVTVVDPIPDGVLAIGNVAFDPAIGPPDCDALPTPPNCTGIPTEPNVAIAKALTGESGSTLGIAEAGEQLTYTITLTNAGGTDATPQAITDALDPNVVFVSANNGGVHDGAAQGGDIDWTGLTVPADSTLVLTVLVTVIDPIPAGVESIGNVAFDPAIGIPDCDAVPAPPNCTGIPTAPRVAIAKALTAESGTEAGLAEPGEQLTYTITVTNAGGSDATGQSVIDALDPNVSFVSASNGGTAASGQVTWSGLTVPAGGSLALTVVVQVADPIPSGVESIGNVAYDPLVGPPNCDATPTPPNCTRTPVDPRRPVLDIEKTVSGSRYTPGASGTYTVMVTVSPDSIALRGGPVVVDDPMPAPLTIDGTVTGTDWDCSASTATRANCVYTGSYPVDVGGAVGGAITIPFTVPANASAGNVVNVARVTYGPDSTSADDEASIVVGGAAPLPPVYVPVDSHWMLLLMGALLGFVAALRIRTTTTRNN